MTDKLDAIDRLIATVEAGTLGQVFDEIEQAGIHKVVAAYEAYDGSLDAALSLKDALLPGAMCWSIVADALCLCAKVNYFPDGLSGKREMKAEGWHEGCAARALLLATLRVYRHTVAEVSA